MDVTSRVPHSEIQVDRYPLLMENQNGHEHVIDITGDGDASPSALNDEPPCGVDQTQVEDRSSSSTRNLMNQNSLSSSNRSNSRNSSLTRRRDGYGLRRRQSPLNSGLWISVELVVTVSQIVASIVVLSLSKDENPQAPLFEWIVGYACGCVATLPLLYWRYRNRNRGQEQDSTEAHRTSSQANAQTESASYAAVSMAQASEEVSHTTAPAAVSNRITESLHARLNRLVDHFKMALDCFFAVWFVVGNVWIFGGHSSSADAPKLYRLCIVFLTFSCIGYAMPFILCATICCCLPCIISILGLREDPSLTRGAAQESINALPTYKFKLKKNGTCNGQEVSPGISEVGLLAAGTEKERAISGEDAVCCICLSEYADNDELRELPCTHFFHVECVDKWLKINAQCPLCKYEIGETNRDSTVATTPIQLQNERVANGSAEGAFYGSTML
ncbi:Zinc finger, RING-type [Dillenia turbinata]|uniref:Zinc finger, RING-type n=1 Tax=Dillenia turbinata TaxID=194707 RepID=A0AAN8UDS1_9MAGN